MRGFCERKYLYSHNTSSIYLNWFGIYRDKLTYCTVLLMFSLIYLPIQLQTFSIVFFPLWIFFNLHTLKEIQFRVQHSNKVYGNRDYYSDEKNDNCLKFNIFDDSFFCSLNVSLLQT